MRRLLLAASERETEKETVAEAAWSAESNSVSRKVATLTASASYERAVKLGKRLAGTADAKGLLELHDLLARDPMADLGFSDIREVFEDVRSRIVERFRQSAYPRGGWGFG